MNNKKFSLPNPLPIDRELLAKAIFDANNYLGECKARVHYLEKYTKVYLVNFAYKKKETRQVKKPNGMHIIIETIQNI